jgi:hypothetical protein
VSAAYSIEAKELFGFAFVAALVTTLFDVDTT